MMNPPQTHRFRFCLWLIRFVGLIVPRRLRADWRQEWEAELSYRAQMLEDWDRLDWHNKLDLLGRSLWALRDALLLQPRRLEDEMIQDLRYGVRMLLLHKGFTAVAVLSLALGIGATTAVFSLVNGYLLRPLPYPTAERLYSVEVDDNTPAGFNAVSWDGAADVFEQIIAWDLDSFSLSGISQPEAVDGAWVTPGFFTATETKPVLGRAFLPEEAAPGGRPVAVISHGLWQRRFGSDPEVVGKAITVSSADRPDEAERVIIIGVLPADFWFFHKYTEMLLPLQGNRMPSMGTLKPGMTAAQAAQQLTSIVRAQVQKTDPDWSMQLLPTRETYVREVRPSLWLLLAAVALALLIACGNVVFLLLIRAAGREKEMAVRRALGASRLRIVRQMLTECLLLTVLAGALGVVLAQVSVTLLGQLIETQLGRNVPGGVQGLELDFTVLLLAAALSLLIALIFALVPVLAGARAPLTMALSESGRGATDSRRRRRTRNALVTVELAVSLALLIGAGLLIRSAVHLNRLELGFDPERVLKANLTLPQRQYPEAQTQLDFFERLLARVRQLPGVEAASLTNMPPFRAARGWPLEVEGRIVERDRDAVRAVQQTVSTDYFRTMNIPLRRGRAFTEQDRAGAAPVIMISEKLAESLWPGENPLGKRLKNTGSGSGALIWREVIGVVGEVRKSLIAEPLPDTYIPMQQNPRFFLYLMMRTSSAPLSFTPELRAIVSEMNPNLPISEIAVMDEVVLRAGARSRFLAALLAGFSLFAVVLAMLGVYGVISYAVSQRAHEIAIRMALGAEPRDVVRLFIRQGVVVVGAGIGLGLLIGLLLSRVLSKQIYGVTTTDPLTYVGLAALMLMIALLACYAPARRAAKVDPMVALRHQ